MMKKQRGQKAKLLLNEACIALRNMKHSKSPGSDGFNVEIFSLSLSLFFFFFFEQNRHVSS